ncbi:MAG: carboxypeptidase regulatory-like domain-containing protein, partial [Myxococcota bacterium]
DLELLLTPRPSLGGVVVDQAGAPVADATVRVTTADATRGPQPSAVTDAAGNFELLGLAPAAYDLAVTHRTGARLDAPNPDTLRVDLTSQSIDDLTLTVRVPDGVIAGVVVGPDGEPYADAWVAMQGGDSDAEPRPQLTDSDGAFSFAQLADGPHTLRAWSSNGDAVAERTEVTTGTEVELQLRERGTVRGRVVANGIPVRKFQLRSARLFARTFISDDGTFEIERVAVGSSTIEVSAPEGSLSQPIDVQPGEPTELELVIEPWATVTGRVTSPEGEPVEGLSVIVQFRVAHNFISGAGFRNTGDGVTTDADGRFTIDRIPTGDVTLAFRRGTRDTGFGVGGTSFTAASGKLSDVGDVAVLTSPPVAPERQGTLGIDVTRSRTPPGVKAESAPDADEALWITGVDESGPAARSGLSRGDRILGIDGHTVARVGAKTADVLFGRRRIERGRSYEVEVQTDAGTQTVEIVAAPR